MFDVYGLSKHLRFINVRDRGKLILLALGILLIITGWLIGPIAQDITYHNFADQRPWLGIPNAFNVVSNFAFSLSSIAGLVFLTRRRLEFASTSGIYAIFLFAVFFIGPGSAYYHLNSNNVTLVWDRLPMSVAFMAFCALIIAERIDLDLGRKLLPWLLIAGISSVAYWYWREDLRPYIFVQFGPMLGLPYLIWRYSGPGTRWLWLAMAFYFLSKIFEFFDLFIYESSTELISGHVLKHVTAATGALMIALKINYTEGVRN